MKIKKVVSGEGVLPEGFELERSGEGVLEFVFKPGVELPYLQESLEGNIGPHSFTVSNTDLARLTLEALKVAIPNYCGRDFYGPLDLSFSDKLLALPDGKLNLSHSVEGREIANLAVDVFSPDSFFPTKNEGVVRRPVIERCSLEGYVTISTRLPKVDGEGDYSSNLVTKPIMEALLTGNDLVLGETGFVRNGFRKIGDLNLYVKVVDPTVNNMELTIAEVKAIGQFFQEYQGVLSVLGSGLDKIYAIQRDGGVMMQQVEQSIVSLGQMRKLVPTLPRIVGMDVIPDLLTDIERSIFAEVNYEIQKLSPTFPKGIIKYAIPKNS